VGVRRTFDEWAFEKKLCVVNAGSDAQLRFHSISDIPAIIGHSSRNAERRMYLKLMMLFLLLGFVVGLPYFFEKIWAIWKGRQAIDITKAGGSSSFNRKS
jgi:hypothetical protein